MKKLTWTFWRMGSLPRCAVAMCFFAMPYFMAAQSSSATAAPAGNLVQNAQMTSSYRDQHRMIRVQVLERRTHQPVSYSYVEIWGLEAPLPTYLPGDCEFEIPCSAISGPLIVHAGCREYFSNTMFFDKDSIPRTIEITLYLERLRCTPFCDFQLSHNEMGLSEYIRKCETTLGGLDSTEAAKKMAWLLQR